MLWDQEPQPPTRGRVTQELAHTAWEENFHYIGPGGVGHLGLSPSIWANPHSTSKAEDKARNL
eukprot:16340334-Heterocapsa_arctica.AAC.1